MYYGISAIDIDFQPEIRQLMLFDLSNPSNLNQSFQGNKNLKDIQLAAFFIRQLDCPPNKYFDPY